MSSHLKPISSPDLTQLRSASLSPSIGAPASSLAARSQQVCSFVCLDSGFSFMTCSCHCSHYLHLSVRRPVVLQNTAQKQQRLIPHAIQHRRIRCLATTAAATFINAILVIVLVCRTRVPQRSRPGAAMRRRVARASRGTR